MRFLPRMMVGLALAATLVDCEGDGAADVGRARDAVTPRETASATETPPGQTYRDNGVRFTYPKRWDEFTVTETSASSGNELWNQTIGIDDVNFVSVSGYEIELDVTQDNIDEQADPVGRQMGSVFAQAGGELVSGPDITTVAGLPALTFVGTAVNPSGEDVGSRLVLAFDGTIEYFVNCQYDDAGERQITDGCDLILSTFEIAD